MSTDLKAELARLEAAWASIGHPLADPLIRPPGRPAAETQRAAVELLGHELPTELVELWEWWGGHTGYTGGVPYELPGGLYIISLESAVEVLERRRYSQRVTPTTDGWIPPIQEDGAYCWAEVSNADSDGRTPISYTDRINDPDTDDRERFDSVAEFIATLSTLAEDGRWIQDRSGYWNYPD